MRHFKYRGSREEELMRLKGLTEKWDKVLRGADEGMGSRKIGKKEEGNNSSVNSDKHAHPSKVLHHILASLYFISLLEPATTIILIHFYFSHILVPPLKFSLISLNYLQSFSVSSE